MRHAIAILGIAAMALAAALGLAACSTPQGTVPAGPIYLPSAMTIQYQNNTFIESYAYDQRGNLLSTTDSRVKTGGGTRIDVSGDIERYEAGASYSATKTYTLNANGIPTASTSTVVNGGNQTVTQLELNVETDANGLWTTITATRDGSIDYTAQFEYKNGIPVALSRDHGRGIVECAFDESGWEDGTGDLEESNAYDKEGRLIASKLYGRNFTFEYDDNGCLVRVLRDGAVEAEISYIVVEDPSPSARAFSFLKLKGVGSTYPYTWYWDPAVW